MNLPVMDKQPASTSGTPRQNGGLVPAPESFIGGIWTRLFDFFASLKLAIFLLVAMVTIFAAGTILESYYGTDAAKILIYDTVWLEALLFLLAVNLAASAFSRWPWQKKHVGFVLTHLGIIIILIGSLVTKRWMLDAQMPVQKGATESRVTLPDPMLYLFEEDGTGWQIGLKQHAFAWSGEERLTDESKAPVRVTVLDYFPKGRLHEEIVSAAQGPAALQVHLENSFMNQDLWLFSGDEARRSVQMGPARLVLSDQLMQASLAPGEDTAYLEFKWPDRMLNIPLKDSLKLPFETALEGTEYRVRLTDLYQNAMIDGGHLVEQPLKEGEAPNRAAVLFLTGPGGEEKHTVFAKHPDFPTQHGMKPSATGAQLYYRLPGGGSRGQSHELRFVPKDAKLLYQILTGPKIEQGTVETGKEIATGWMGMIFRVNAFYPAAESRRFFTAEPNTTQSTQAMPAVRVRLDSGGESKTLWLGEQMPETVVLGGKTLRIFFGRKQSKLDFKLTLRDFRVEEYPGTDRPASFESDVTLRDDFRGVQKDVTISMNNPLVYRGVRIFQASYSRTPGEPDISVFAVGFDPGIGIKYAGAVIMIAGIITMFYFKKFSSVKGFSE